jgi:hypothetical protein
MFTSIVTTCDRYTEDSTIGESVVLDANKTAGAYKSYQRVIAVGDSVRNVKVGDIVEINPSRYIRRKYDDNSIRNDLVENPTMYVDIPMVYLNDEGYFLIQENDVSYVIEEYEIIEDTPKVNLIKPRTPELKV